MAQKLIQAQEQQQVQQQHLTQQQMLEVKMLEMPLPELEQNIAAELYDNPALEKRGDDPDDFMADGASSIDASGEESYGDDMGNDAADNSTDDGASDALDAALSDLDNDDRMPSADSRLSMGDGGAAEEEEMVWGDSTSFYDSLKAQMGEMSLSEQEQSIMEYLIGSLDTDGLLRKPLDSIADELAIYQNIDVSDEEVESVLKKLQTFDPPGIGARSLQECLLLQIDRLISNAYLRRLMHEVLSKHFDAFKKMHWDKIANALNLSREQALALRDEIRKLNPKPGAALGETEGKNMQQITPDFIVDTDADGNVSFTINQGNLPELRVSKDFSDMVDTYRNNKKGMSRQEKEALLYAKQKVDRAQGFIEAVKQRRRTLAITMQAIIEWQKKYFQDGDEADLRPMILKDIAQKTGLDISTISRVGNEKYAQTRWGTFPLRHFFTESYVTDEGEEMSTRKIKIALKEIVDAEDKQKPLSDDALAKLMKAKGYPVARRTITKYREQLGIPMARLRKN